MNLSNTLVPSFDALREIHLQQEEAHLEIGTAHVRGHQDKVKKADQLTLPERINIEADTLATQAYNFFKTTRGTSIQYDLPHGGPYLVIDNKAIWSGEIKLLRWRRSEFQLQEYYCSKIFNFTNISTLYTINWVGFRIARNAMTPGLITFSSKLTINWLPTNQRNSKCGQSTFSECILCGDDETNTHLLMCPCRIDTMTEVMIEFSSYLSEIKTDPKMTHTYFVT